LAGLGLVSYGVYLYHWPVYLWLAPERVDAPWAALLALRLGVTLALAIVSYVVVEQPVRTGVRLRGVAPRIVAPAAAAALVGGLVAVTASPPPPAFVLEPLGDAPPAVAPRAAGDAAGAGAPARAPEQPAVHRSRAPAPTGWFRPLEADRPLRILVVGDSVGVTFGRGMELWAAETGAAVVRNEARQWCSLGRHLPRIDGFGPAEPGRGCDDWEDRWRAVVEEFDPDLALVLYTIWEVAPRELPGADEFVRPGDPELDAWQLAEYHAAADVLSARGARVAWLTIPCGDEPYTPGEPFWVVNERTIPRLAREHPAVRAVDLDAELCGDGPPGSDYRGVEGFRPDDAHFSDEGALAVARWVMSVVRPDPPPPTAAPPWSAAALAARRVG
jgi:hypothetical protein